MEEVIAAVEITKEREFKAKIEFNNGQISTLKSKSLEELLSLVVDELQEYFDTNL